MSLFGNLKNEGLEQTQDRLGGFSPLESDIYSGKIKVAYATTAASGARAVTIVGDFGGKEYRETFYVTNRKGENWFLNKQDPTKKVPLPGFSVVDDICLICTGAPLADQDTEDKVLNLYDPDQKKEIPKSVPVLTDLTGKEVSLAILRQTVNKNEKVGEEYVPTAETRDENITDKAFDTESRFTVVEARTGQKEPKFWDAWLERNKGVTRDRRSIKDGVAAPTKGSKPTKPGSPPAQGQGQATAAPRQSLFGRK